MTNEWNHKIALRLMHRLEVFPSFRPEKRPDVAVGYTEALLRMLSEFGYELTSDAVTSAIDEGGAFPPTPGEIRSRVRANSKKLIDESDVFQVIDERQFYQCEHGLFFGTPCADCASVQEAPLAGKGRSEQKAT